jgi:hypothetical protein
VVSKGMDTALDIHMNMLISTFIVKLSLR